MALRSAKHMHGYTIRATDGDIGSVSQFLFDDEQWTVRYLVVDTGGWLTGRLVLISPRALGAVNEEGQSLDVNLTRQQVEDSPDISTDQPVSRQMEAEYHSYYGYEPYWDGAERWGTAMYPAMSGYPNIMPPMSTTPTAIEQELAAEATERGDPHLHSTHEVTGYAIQARDGEIGHVEDFIVDDETWAMRYMVVDTRNWWPGKQVLVTPEWLSDISWSDRHVNVDLEREVIKSGPEFDPSALLNRDYETILHRHYGRVPYWEAERRS